MNQVLVLYRDSAPSGAPFFSALARRSLWAVLLMTSLARADVLVEQAFIQTDYATARESLIETIEAEGLVVGSVLQFGDLLDRTAKDLGHAQGSPLLKAETVQFCSARLAWSMVEEHPAKLTNCPLAVSIYVERQSPDRVMIAYRVPGEPSPAVRQAENLLKRLVDRAIALARLR